MRKNAFAFLVVIAGLLAVSFKKAPTKETQILIQTSLGDIRIKLYDETPVHRDNFIKLVNNHFYDSLLFHRVIEQFMIQAGDPKSKTAAPGIMLGQGDVGYTLPAEFIPSLYHKKGALAAARQGDNVNPKKESSGCQFYIVQGKSFANTDLDMIEARFNQPLKIKLFNDYVSKPENEALKNIFIHLQATGNTDSLKLLSAQLEPTINELFKSTSHFSFSEEQRKTYTTVGGSPHLDGSYTVFGEVIDGFEVIDKIATVEVDGNSRPKNDVKIISMKIVKPKKGGKKNKRTAK